MYKRLVMFVKVKCEIKMSGSESQDQETAYAHIFRPMRSLQ